MARKTREDPSSSSDGSEYEDESSGSYSDSDSNSDDANSVGGNQDNSQSRSVKYGDNEEYDNDSDHSSSRHKYGSDDHDQEQRSDPETAKPAIDWDNLTEEQQMMYDKYTNDQNRKIRALSEQKFHLPGNDWKQDWVQYFSNNHPILGVCLHDRVHPVGWGMRIMCFVSSAVFGLALTNMFWLWARSSENNEAVFTLEVGTRPGSNLTGYVVDVDENNAVQVTPDIIALWTVGGMIHGAFDNLIWTLSICACCDVGAKYEHLAKYKRFGVGLLGFFVVLVMALTTLTVVVRGVIENSEEEPDVSELQSAGIFDDTLDLSTSTKENYEFLMSYTVEMALAMGVYFPLLGTIFFWGVLGCFKYSCMGGRPYELIEERRELEEMMLNPNEHLDGDYSNSEWEDEPVFGMKGKGDGGSGFGSLFDCFKKKGGDKDEGGSTAGSSQPERQQRFFSRRQSSPDESEELVDEPSDNGSSSSKNNSSSFLGRMKRNRKEIVEDDGNNGYPAVVSSKRYDPKTGEELPPKKEESKSWFGGGSKKTEGSENNAYPSVNSSTRYDPSTGTEYSRRYEADAMEEQAAAGWGPFGLGKKKTDDNSGYPSVNKSATRYDPTTGEEFSSNSKKAKAKNSTPKKSSSAYPKVNKKASRLDPTSTSDSISRSSKKKSAASSDYPSVDKRSSRMDVNSASDKAPKKKKSGKKKSSKS